MGRIGWWIDRGVDGFYNVVVVQMTNGFTAAIRAVHSGSHVMYVGWSIAGLLIMMWFLLVK